MAQGTWPARTVMTLLGQWPYCGTKKITIIRDVVSVCVIPYIVHSKCFLANRGLNALLIYAHYNCFCTDTF